MPREIHPTSCLHLLWDKQALFLKWVRRDDFMEQLQEIAGMEALPEILIPSIIGLLLFKVFSNQNGPVVPLAPHQTQAGLEYWHFWGVTGPWVRGIWGTGDINPLKHNPNLQGNKSPRMGSSLSGCIQDFCYYSSFKAIDLQEKYKDLQVFFSFTYKKVQNHFRLKAGPQKSSKTLQRCHGMKQIPTSHSPIPLLLKTPTDPWQIFWVDLHICFWFLKGTRMIFAFYSSFKSEE